MEPKEATKADAVAPAAGAAAVDVGGAGAKSKPHCSSASAGFFATHCSQFPRRAQKKMSSIMSWENTKKAAAEAKLRTREV